MSRTTLRGLSALLLLAIGLGGCASGSAAASSPPRAEPMSHYDGPPYGS